MLKQAKTDTVYLEQAEQRRYRRLEVSLPVWLAEEDDFNKPSGAQWSLGYTRDISMGGAKVIVPDAEEDKWRDASKRDCVCLVRFDVPGSSHVEYITGRVKHAAHEKDTGRLWLGVEYDEGNREEKAAAVRAGLKTVKTRRRWQGLFVLALAGIGLAAIQVKSAQEEAEKQKRITRQKEAQRKKIETALTRLSRARLVSTRAEGINSSFERKEVQKLLANLTRLNNPNNKDKVEQDRANRRSAEGITLARANATGANVSLGIALPYGYAWPEVTDNIEQLIGRTVPTVVIFRDFKAKFPLEDCLEARARTKTLQITWEPWHFSNPKAVPLKNIIAGKHDRYIDSWANAAKSFGGELWIRWGHEFNGNWYPWSTAANNQSPKNYIAAFRHVHRRFTRAGAFNVRWIWCMNAETVPNTAWNDPIKAYPGDAYVDMISIDGYNFGTSLSHSKWLRFAEVFAIPYDKVVRRFPNKPLMIGETACATVGGPTGTGKDKAAWIYDMDKTLRTMFPRISGVVWFETQKEADWRMGSSLEALQACRKVWRKSYYRRGET